MKSKWKGNPLPLKIYKLSLSQYNNYYFNLRTFHFKVDRFLKIFNFFSRLKFYIYNGRKWLLIYVLIKKHLKMKFGELYFTKKRSIYLSRRKLKKLKRKKKLKPKPKIKPKRAILKSNKKQSRKKKK